MATTFVGAVVVRDPERALEVNAEDGVPVHFGEGEDQDVLLELDHQCLQGRGRVTTLEEASLTRVRAGSGPGCTVPMRLSAANLPRVDSKSDPRELRRYRDQSGDQSRHIPHDAEWSAAAALDLHRERHYIAAHRREFAQVRQVLEPRNVLLV